MDAADLLGDWAVRDHVLTLGRSFDPRAFELRRAGRPGYVAGGWLTVEGRFATRMTEFAAPGPGGVGEPDVPAWLASAVRVGRGRGGVLLRDIRGRVTARLVRRGDPRPPASPGPAALPPGLVPVARPDLPGCWIPEGRTVPLRTRTPSLLMDAGGTFRATDGANDLAGLWLPGTAGRLEGTGGETTMIGGFGLVDVPRWLARTCRAGLDGETLVLLDTAGAQVGRLERAHERAWPERGRRTGLGSGPWTHSWAGGSRRTAPAAEH